MAAKQGEPGTADDEDGGGRPLAFAVDDEPAITRFITRALSSLGIETVSLPSAGAALAALQSRTPAIIFLDVALEGSDAVDVIRGLGENGYRGAVQLMSGSDLGLLNDVRRVGERHRLNMLPPLEKPFRLAAIRGSIAAARLDGTAITAPASLQAGQGVNVGLEEALRAGWLELWYQPKVDLRSGMICGAEGLIRGRHPDGTLLLPHSLLADAGADAHIALTAFVIDRAFEDWGELAAAGGALKLALNTTVGALERLPLAQLIRERRPKDAGWPGLILEMTETEVVKDVALAHEIATQLRIYGISLAIDDFGQGYSSFARLKDLPFAELKLDRSFVHGCATDARNDGICKAVIDLAHHFGATAAAEGLENADDLRTIRGLGCDLGQGYLFARPMPKADFVRLLQRRAPLPQADASLVAAFGRASVG